MSDFGYEYVSQLGDTAADTGPKPPLDLRHHYSRVTRQRHASDIKKFYKYFQIPGIGNLAGGLPNETLFPFDTLEAQIALPDRFNPTPNDPNGACRLARRPATTPIDRPKHGLPSSHLTVPHNSGIPNLAEKIDLATALQYGQAQGYPPLYSFLRQFTRENLHPGCPYRDGPDIVLTNGNTDGFSKAIEALSNPWIEQRDWVREREGILCEEFAYMNAIETAQPRGLNIVPVKVDLEGMLATGPGGLEDVLKNWDETKGKRPHLMYTVSIGQNPTSGTQSVKRREEIYALCSSYDIIIIEDEPYWYLQYPSAIGKEATARGTTSPKAEASDSLGKYTELSFLDSLVPSYINLDHDGRVVRLDTFSKTVAPGCRLGWITAQPSIIERITRITETSTQQPSGFVQSIIAELLMGPQPAAMESFKKYKLEQRSFSGWQTGGWIRWLEGLRGSYERRMNEMCDILEAGRFQLKQGTPIKSSDSDWAVISKTEMYSFDWPRAGMFVWIHMRFDSHPLWGQVDGPKLAEAQWKYLTKKPFLALVAPGAIFSPTPEIAAEKGWQFFRLSFAAVAEEDIERCSKGFAEGVKAFWSIKSKHALDEINDEVNSQAMSEGLVDLGMNWAC